MCFIPKDEVELQQDDENLPYEEEIYKDSSTFLKVTNFCSPMLHYFFACELEIKIRV